MNKRVKIIALIFLILTPILFYSILGKKPAPRKEAILIAEEQQSLPVLPRKEEEEIFSRPKVAIIFDDLGENIKDMKEIHSLKAPLSVSIIPGLPYSMNMAYMGLRCGFSVLVHLPMEPKREEIFRTAKYRFISSSQSLRQNRYLLRSYLDYIRIAVGANNHLGSRATEDRKLMKLVLLEVKRKGMFFVDSRTSSKSVACEVAREEGVSCANNEGFADANDNEADIEKYINFFMETARKKGKIILILHPRKNTFRVLKRLMPRLKKEAEFITMRNYFEP